MKRHFTSILFCIFFPLCAIAQVDWAKTGAEWYYEYQITYTPEYDGYVYKKVEGDTMLNDVNCRHISSNWYRASGVTVTTNQFTFEREDSIFYYDALKDDFRLHFVTNLEVGDTFDLINFEGDTITAEVTVNDFMNIDGTLLEY